VLCHDHRFFYLHFSLGFHEFVLTNTFLSLSSSTAFTTSRRGAHPNVMSLFFGPTVTSASFSYSRFHS
jgi:hypothetical protein